ncbi:MULTISPECIES: response regulator transcription factor [Streptomyces]|uniref:Putative two component system response regulator n=3 Tax=Streptomyces scabiei TaxID=1930 RepID=C9Z078_STRSW|nr:MULTISPECIES: response regulator transcription factor [Streptomyces]MBP5871656.1 response regulator transcription factor [Streptomyces sp. LBUM 1485]MBP5909764.1 response regulator transcription factor [Streptomyces sp. LBUM 1478]MBP5927020.1 response regulator transcription factor [Streptomyces sp. LBUM 1479]KFG06470.1 LuxR family transcriptional regulator [Streptomyces scabiei]MBP5912344.1 response regulator transcription factor [Streptomyces sp. LBUM 1486]
MNDRSPIRVLIADDQDMVRTGFRFFLDAQPDITVVAEAADGETAVRLARELRPDVCLLDIRMPRLDGLEATRLLAGPGVADPLRVVVVTTFDLDEYVYGALRGGACGFLLKDSGPTLLAEAVRAAAAGDALVSPSVTVRLLRHVTAEKAEAPERKEKTGRAEKRRQEGGAGPGAPRSQEALTERELDVVRLVALGHTNAEIAASMFVSLSTVKTHLGSIQLKLAARNRVEIAAWAWRTGHAGKQG